MNNYCGFIEVWNDGIRTDRDLLPMIYADLNYLLKMTKEYGFKTVAIFKIKLDGGYNKTKN